MEVVQGIRTTIKRVMRDRDAIGERVLIPFLELHIAQGDNKVMIDADLLDVMNRLYSSKED